MPIAAHAPVPAWLADGRPHRRDALICRGASSDDPQLLCIEPPASTTAGHDLAPVTERQGCVSPANVPDVVLEVVQEVDHGAAD